MYAELKQGSGKNAIATTMALVRLLKDWMKDPEIGKRIVPIAPDEYRTFGMDSMFPSAKVYNPGGQQYESVDRKLLLSYKESAQGQMLHEGISEAGAMASATAAGSAYSTHGEHMIPFYIFYSMFGFQRTGDSIWAMADQLARGFLIGATAGRTTLTGEGLQHADGHSPLLAATNPAVVHYDPAFAYEISHIMQSGLERMYGATRLRRRGRHLLPHRLQRAGRAAEGARGRRRRGHPARHPPVSHGRGRRPARAAARLRRRLPVGRRGGPDPARGLGRRGRHLVGHVLERAGPRRDRRRGVEPAQPRRGPRTAYVTDKLADAAGPVVAVSDYMRAVPLQIARWVPGDYRVLGADGFGFADTRPAARRFFHVDAQSVVVQALQALADAGEIDRRRSQEAFDDVPHRRPDRRRRRQARGRRRLDRRAVAARAAGSERPTTELQRARGVVEPCVGRRRDRARRPLDTRSRLAESRARPTGPLTRRELGDRRDRRSTCPLRSSWRHRAREYVAGWVDRMNSLTIFTNRCGWSLCGKWPALGITSTWALGASSAALLACRTGITLSSRPQTTHIGIASVR